ncbi:MAG: hypothetical protein LBJ11_05635 [Oscillospiraceae bacterium]|nr:hypothetical protein [Oscillospiraceae bacterium]
MALSLVPSHKNPTLEERIQQNYIFEYLKRTEAFHQSPFHTFSLKDEGKPHPSFHAIQDLKDMALKQLREAGNNVYFNRILLENVFLLFRHMVIYERKLTFWKMPQKTEPQKTEEKRYLKQFSPFYQYRELWAALLAQYWATTDEVYADHIRRTVAIYFAQLLQTRPCEALADIRECAAQKNCDKNNFPQSGCQGQSKNLDSVLVAAFAECVCSNGNKLMQRRMALLDAVFDAVLNLDKTLGYPFWLFATDCMLRDSIKRNKKSLNAAEKRWYEAIGKKVFDICSVGEGNGPAAQESSMMEAYVAACMAAETVDEKKFDTLTTQIRGEEAWGIWVVGEFSSALETFKLTECPNIKSLMDPIHISLVLGGATGG